MKKITFSLIFVFGLMGFNIVAVANETQTAQEPSATDQLSLIHISEPTRRS